MKCRVVILAITLTILLSMMPSILEAQVIGWEKYFHGARLGTDSGYGVEIYSDYVIAVGKYWNESGYTKVFIANLSKNDGSLNWITGLTLHDRDRGYDVAVSGSGDVYVVGRTLDVDQGAYYGFIAKLDSDGGLRWSKIWRGADYEGRGVALDSSGYVYVAGEFLTDSQVDCLIMKLDPADGSPIWGEKIGGANADYAYDIAIDSMDYIYVVGENGSTSSTFILKLDTDGGMIWGIIWKIGALDTEGRAIAVDQNGDIYIAGSTQSPSDIFVAKFDKYGVLRWARIWDSGGDDEAYSITVDSGHVYVVGSTDGFGSRLSALIIAFDQNGELAWDIIWDGSGLEEARGAISGSLYITGYTDSQSLSIVDVSGVVTDITDQPIRIGGEPTAVAISLIPLGSEYTPTPSEGHDPAGSRDIFILRLDLPLYETPVGGEISPGSPIGLLEKFILPISFLMIIAIILIAINLCVRGRRLPEWFSKLYGF